MKDYEKQITEILGQLTLEEKCSMLHGCGFFRTAPVERLGIPGIYTSDGPMGVRNEFPDDSWIPVGHSDDYVNYAPSNSALAATWNPDRAYAGGQILGEEVRGRGKDVSLAPGINIKRDPRCGRNFEYMSEDPYLIQTLVVPFIQGLQESDVAACVKHFAVNCQETNRLWVDTIVDERTLKEIYLPGFEAAVHEGGSYSIMNAYNKLNGTHCSENQDLLDRILRGEWGYDGVVISDWGSVHTTVEAAHASIDMDMSVTTNFDEYFFANPLIEAVQKGEVAEELVDAKVRNVLRLMFRLKMLGEEADQRKQGAYATPEHARGDLKTAEESIVLLKNEAGKLPLTKEDVDPVWDGNPLHAIKKKRIAVIGHNAEHLHANGGGSGEIKALYEISPLMGLKQALGGSADVVYAQGYYIPDQKKVNEVNWQETSLERQVMEGEKEDTPETIALRKEIEENRAKLRKEACKLAASADLVLFVGGLNHDYDVEGWDRPDMKLPYGQDELIEELLKVKPDAIVTIVAGSAVEMPWLSKAQTLVWSYYAGMETGTALAEVLLGKVNPSGKLPETFPVKYEDTATFKNGEFGKEDVITLQEGIFVGYRYYEKEKIAPAFAFGHGLSYTEFELSDLDVAIQYDGEEAKPSVAVQVTATNVGDMAGAEVVQCYVSDVECSVERPVKELKGYAKVFLQPGESKDVTIELPERAFAFYDVEKGDFTVEPGRFVISVGNASDNCTLKEEITYGAV